MSGRAPVLGGLVVGDDPEAWQAAGFAVTDGITRLGSVALHLVGGADGRGIRSWAFSGLPDEVVTEGAIDGLPITVLGAVPVPADQPHPNGSVGIDHVVLASGDTARTTRSFEAAGFEVRRVRDTERRGLPMRQVFFKSGPVILELVGPVDPSGDDPAAFFGLALTVDDLDRATALLGPALGAPKDAVQRGRRIATLRHRDLGMSVATALMSPEPGR